MTSGWIGVDLDGTLAMYPPPAGIDTIGAPIAPMVARVREWLDAGIEVRIVTARVGSTGKFVSISDRHDDGDFAAEQMTLIQDWCEKHIGQRLEVTASKDFAMMQLWDDRAVQVRCNTGIPVGEHC